MFENARRSLAAMLAPTPAPLTQIGVAQNDLPRFDVTANAAAFDLSFLEPVVAAPVWMSRAERLLLFTLAFTLHPRRYVEIGTFQGGSALIVNAALDALESDGRIFCVDPEPRVSPENWQKLSQRAQMFKGFSPAILQEVATAAGAPFDLALIDGDHSYDGAHRDAAGIFPYMQSGAYMLFHDGFFPDVKRAIDDFVVARQDKLVDFGLLTREITTQAGDTGAVEWGGIRVVFVR